MGLFSRQRKIRMKSIRCAIMVMLLSGLVSLSTVVTAGDQDVLQSLERLRDGIGAGDANEDLKQMLSKAKVHVDSLKPGPTSDHYYSFRMSVANSYYWFHRGMITRETILNNVRQRAGYETRRKSSGPAGQEMYGIMIRNFDLLIARAQDALPSMWMQGDRWIDEARQTLAAYDQEPCRDE